MKRIAGILNLDRTPVESAVINQMLDTLKLGADDTKSFWVDEGVGLGCTYSKEVTGKSIDHLLSSHPGLQCAITFDGRIDNRRELYKVLGSQLTADLSTDLGEEIILAAYEKWGLDCPRHLVGDFAFAIWDPTHHRLVCVRDHLGVKPFYYCQGHLCVCINTCWDTCLWESPCNYP